MANEVTPLFKGGTSVVSGANLAQRMAESAQNDPRGGSGDSLYLNFSGKLGRYTIGPNNRRVEADEMWVINIASFEDGWVCWKASRPAAQRMSNIFTGVPIPAPDPEELGPFDTRNGEGWHQAKAVTMKSLDNDEQGYFKINSKSGVSALAALQREIVERSQAGLACWPIVRLDNEEFKAQGYTNFKPVFHIDGWLNDENVVKLADPEADFDALLSASGGSASTDGDDDNEDEEPPAAEQHRRRRRSSAL